MRIICVAGARPNFMKIAPVLAELDAHGADTTPVHTGQHYDPLMSDVFFGEGPRRCLRGSTGRPPQRAGRGVPQPAHGAEVRQPRAGAQDHPGHLARAGRGQDDDRGQPGRRLGPGRGPGGHRVLRPASPTGVGALRCGPHPGLHGRAGRRRRLRRVAPTLQRQHPHPPGRLPTPNPSELLASHKAAAVVAKALAEQPDVVLVDSTPVPPVTDALVLSRFAGATFALVDSHSTARKAARRTLQLLGQINARVLGVVFNGPGGGSHGNGYAADTPKRNLRGRTPVPTSR